MATTNNRSQDEIFCSLLAKKMTGEASSEELQQFQALLLVDFNRQHQADIILQLWQQRLQASSPEAEAAYIRHLIKHKAVFFDITPEKALPPPVRLDDVIEEMIVAEPQEVALVVGNNSPSASPKTISKWWVGAGVIAVLLMAVLIMKLLSLSNNKANGNALQAGAGDVSSVSTGNGHRTKLVLPDNTQVWLNAGSRLDYDITKFNNIHREVTLVGEAFFEVTKNSKRPFWVNCSSQRVKATETTFNVSAYPFEKNYETSLLQGTVEVILSNRPDEKYILHPTEKLIVANKSSNLSSPEPKNTKPTAQSPKEEESIVSLKKTTTYSSNANIIIETAWINDQLAFNSESFKELAGRFERWYDVQIEFENEQVKGLKFSGFFENESLEKVLQVLQRNTPFRYSIKGKKVIIR